MAPAVIVVGAVASLAATVLGAPWRVHIGTPTFSKRSTSPSVDRLQGQDFPDPTFWLESAGEVILAATQSGSYKIQKATTDNFENSVYSYSNAELLSQPGAWSTGNYWAPDIGQLTDYDQSYYMYYSASTSDGYHCLGLARSANTTGIGGPYTDGSSSSWICPGGAGGAIDPAGFLDSDGSRYIVYKIDGNYAVGGCNKETSTAIMLQKTTNDGYTLVGDSQQIYDNAGASDQWNTEAPAICRDAGGTYYLFFSPNCYNGDNYQVAYVTASSVAGPYGNRQILLQTGDYGLLSPGGADVSPDCSKIVFHGYSDGVGGPRSLYAGDISASGGSVSFV